MSRILSCNLVLQIAVAQNSEHVRPRRSRQSGCQVVQNRGGGGRGGGYRVLFENVLGIAKDAFTRRK
jgi:hypothetical protein